MEKTSNVIVALDEVLKMLHKKEKDLEKKLNIAKDERQTQEKICVVYKDFELYSFEDIQELYGVGEITEKKFDSLVKELKDKTSGNAKTNEIEKLEYEIKFINHFIKEMAGTKESELQKLGYTDEEIVKMMDL